MSDMISGHHKDEIGSIRTNTHKIQIQKVRLKPIFIYLLRDHQKFISQKLFPSLTM